MSRRRSVVALLVALTMVCATGASGSASPTWNLQTECDPFNPGHYIGSVPTASEVIGIDLGDRDVTVAESDRYLRAVSGASPNVVDGVLGTSVEGRPLRYAVVGDAKNLRNLGQIGRDLNRLRDADTPAGLVRSIIRRAPAVLYVAGNVHGGETSGTDAALRVLYELAARTDCAATQILDGALVVIIPTQNPDGREADTRRNAYDFDMNRDWFAMTQPETEGKIELLGALPPQLFIDAHQMGGESNYFFPPNADPVYHDIGEKPLEWIHDLYGGAMQDAFARFDIPYFNGSFYDLFYMGYGDSVPTTGFNAAGMTFEKSSADSTEVRVREQYTAIWASLTAAGTRPNLLAEWHGEHVTAASQGAAGRLEPNQLYREGAGIDTEIPDRLVRHYFIRTDDPAKAEEVRLLANRLQRMDVEVAQLTRPLQVDDYKAYGYPEETTTLPAGTLWISMDQGQKHWIQAMLNEDTYVPFPYFYDVTAWSGPLLENVDGGSSGLELAPAARPLGSQSIPAPLADADPPSVAIWQYTDRSTSTVESAGWLRWWLDHKTTLRYGEVSTDDVIAGLDGVDVLIVPSGSASTALNALGETGQPALVSWVEDGGRLITLRDVSPLAVELGITTASYESPTSDIPGSLIRAEVDTHSPLAANVGDTVQSMVAYEYVWSTPNPRSAVVRYPTQDDPDWFISGFASGAGQLAGTAAVIDEAYGEGRVVMFGFAPNFRAYTGGTQQILWNAVVGPQPDDPVEVDRVPRRRPREVPDPVTDRMVITVQNRAAARVEALLDAEDAVYDTVTSGNKTSYRVDLGGVSADDHPWAADLAREVADTLGPRVVALRVP